MKLIVSSYPTSPLPVWLRSSDSTRSKLKFFHLLLSKIKVMIAKNPDNFLPTEQFAVSLASLEQLQKPEKGHDSFPTATLVALAVEYHRLISLPKLSDKDEDRMAAILDLAQFDSNLHQSLKQIDEAFDPLQTPQLIQPAIDVVDNPIISDFGIPYQTDGY